MKDIEFINEYSSLVAISVTASDLCRKLVHSPITGSGAVGAQVLALDQQAQFSLLGSYGRGIHVGELSVWDQHPFGESIRNQDQVSVEMEATDGTTVKIFSLPLMKGQDPVGLLVLTMIPGSEVNELSISGRAAVSKITAIWLESLGLSSSGSGNGAGPVSTIAAPESLTDRQLKVLRGMSEGKTNAQIAQDMILSESTIRQETVKIYRALGVSSRTDATKRALHLGILQKVAV